MSAMDVVRTPEERFAGLPGYPFDPRDATLPDGLRMHYIDEGSADAEVVLLLHGQPTWSYLYRTMVARLAQQGLRAVAPDLVGFGRSDKPVARAAYSVQAHVDWLGQFIGLVGLSDLTLVVQDWGGPIGLGVLSTHPGLVRRVVAANTVLHTADPALAGRLEWPCHAGPDGTVTVAQMLLDYQRLTQELTPFRPSLFVQGATEWEVPDAVLAAYDAPFPDETFCAGPRQLPLLMGLTPASECARPEPPHHARRWPPSTPPSSPCSPTAIPRRVLAGLKSCRITCRVQPASATSPWRVPVISSRRTVASLWRTSWRVSWGRALPRPDYVAGLDSSGAASGADAGAAKASGSGGAPVPSCALRAASSLSTWASLPTWSSSF